MPLAYIDYEQIQLWIVVLESGDKAYLDQRRKNEYVHGVFFEQFYKEPFFQPGKPKTKEYRLELDKLGKYKLLRSKAVTHGVNFGRRARSLAKEHNMTEAECQQIIDIYFRLHHWIKEWHQKVEFEAIKHGFIRNRFGTIRRYPVPDNSMYATKAQSTEADIMVRALARIHKRLKPPSRILLPNHDALLLQSPSDRFQDDILTVQVEMERPIKEYDDFVFTTELAVGYNWGEVEFAKLANVEEVLHVQREKQRSNSSATLNAIPQRGTI